MSTDKDRIKWEGFFSVKLPLGWAYNEEQGVISFLKKHGGVGSIQISFAKRHRAGDASIEEAYELAESFAANRKWNIKNDSIHRTEIDGSPATEFVFLEPNKKLHYWQVWHIVSNKIAAFITYNCEEGESDYELMDRVAIVQSFRWEMLDL